MSYNRYRKRDKSEINRKSEIGLGRVENYDSADISENVIHHVRDYLYTPLYLDIDRDRRGSYGVVKFLESGHTMFITSLCKASGASKQVYDTLCGSLVYDKPTDETDISGCPVNFKILGNYDTSPVLIDATVTVTVYQERFTPGGPLQIVTYVGIGMDDLRPFGKHNVRAIGTNLHDYTLGAVDYVDTTDPYDIKNPNFLAQWVFKISDQIKRDLLAVPLYSEALGDYVYAANGENFQTGSVDSATINGVPFCGVYGLTLDGKDARHITVSAKHAGSDLNDAGEHLWEVLKSYPYLKYTKSSTKYQTANDLSQKNSLSDKGGLCYLSDFDDAEGQNMDAFLGTLGYWLSADKKEENLSVSSVITVGILKRFWSILKPLLDTSNIVNNISSLVARLDALEAWQQTVNGNIATINGNISTINDNLVTLQDSINELSDKIDDIEITPVVPPDNPVIPDPPEPEIEEPTEVRRYIDLSLSKGRLSFSDPNGSVSDTTVPTGIIYQEMSDGTVNNLGCTSTLMYSWEYDDAPIKIQVGNTTVSDSDYKTVNTLNGSGFIAVTLTEPVDTPTFSGRELTFYTKDTDNRVAQATVYVSYTNGNVTTHGALIDSKYTDVFLDSSGVSTAAYYPIGSTVNFYVTADEFAEASNTVHAYINQVVSRNGILEKEARYPIMVKNAPSSRFSISESTIQGQAIWGCSDSRMPDPGTQGYTRSFDLYYNGGDDYFMTLVFNIGAQDSYLDLDRYSMTFGPADTTSQRVVASSNFSVDYTNSYDWIMVNKVADMNYDVSVLGYTDSSGSRTGSVNFSNEAGQSRTLQIIQGAAEKYICAIPPFINYKNFVRVTPGSNWSTTYSTADAVTFSFAVESNIAFQIYLDGAHQRSFSSTSSSMCSVSVDLPENQTTQTVTHTIEVKSELDTITLELSMAGQEEKPVISSVSDNIFHKENAFDILRTEKILTVSCEQPDQISLSVSDNDLIAKIYEKTSDRLYIHCYPRTVKTWSSDKTVSLSINYKGTLAKKQDFVIEATTSTVGSYFNVSSTIESFKKSDTNDQTIEITGFSMSGTLKLETTDKRSSLLRISDKQTVTSGGLSYNKWTVTIPKGLVPASKTPWTLTLTNTCSQGSFVKYISIYEASDVAWDTSSYDFQLTAFGHLSIADGCEIMPIVYERRYMKSYIGTNDSPNSTAERSFPVPVTIHDLSRVSLRTSSTYWSLTGGLLKYSTCNNCGQISSDTHNAVTALLSGTGTCTFSNSMDTNFYNDLGLSYTSVYGSEYIYSDTQDSTLSRYVLLPSSKATINHICMQVSNPIKYMTNNNAPNFLPVPPDWKIATNLSGSSIATSHGGYLKLLSMPSSKEGQSFSYIVNSNTNWGTSSTYPGGGKYIVNFRRSDIFVVDEVPDYNPDQGGDSGGGGGTTPGGGGDDQGGGTTATGTVIYDQQDPNNDNLLKWSGPTLGTFGTIGNQYQPHGSRYYFNSGTPSKGGCLTNSGLPTTGGVPSGAKIVTDLNLTFNCANMGNGFNGTSTAPGTYSTSAFANAKMYDLENSKIWDSQETFSGWNNLHSKNRRATFLIDGTGYQAVNVRASRGINVYVGMAGICDASSNDKASILMYVPYVRVTAATAYSSTKKTTDYFLVKYGQRFGLGFTNAQAAETQAIVECAYQLTRTVVNPYNGYFKYNVKISSNSGVTGGGTRMTVPANGAPNLLLDEATGMYTYMTSGTLDFEITHEDFCKIISYHITANDLDTTRTDNMNDSTPWYFYGPESGLDHQITYLVQPYSWLRDLKVTIK